MSIRRVLPILLLALPLASAQAPAVTEWSLPEGMETPLAAFPAEDGSVWVTVENPPSLLRFDPSTAEFQSFDLPVAENSSEDSEFARMGGGRFWGIDRDAGGRFWVADALQGAVLMLDPSTGETRRIDLGNRSGTPIGLTITPDGAIWIAELLGARLVRVDPAAGDVEAVHVPGERPGPLLLATGPDGLLWVTLTYANKVAALDPGTRQWVPTPAGGVPLQAASGLAVPDADTLLATQHAPNLATAINLTDGGWEDYAFVPGEGYPRAEPLGAALVPGVPGEAWVAVHTANRVARLNLTDGSSAEYWIPTEGFANTVLIASDPQGNAWFTQPEEHQVSRAGRVEPGVELWIEPTASLHPGERVTVRVAITPKIGDAPALRLRAAPTTEAEPFLGVAFEQTRTNQGAREATLVVEADADAPPGRYPFVACADDGEVLSCARHAVSLRPAPQSNGTPAVSAILVAGALAAVAAVLGSRGRR